MLNISSENFSTLVIWFLAKNIGVKRPLGGSPCHFVIYPLNFLTESFGSFVSDVSIVTQKAGKNLE